MEGAGLIPLEAIESYNRMFLKCWGHHEFSLLARLDRAALVIARPAKPPSDAPEKVSMSNGLGIREIFRNVQAKRIARQQAEKDKGKT